ncbi:hypothetical protein [Streptomyces sp. PanSC9]|uniref:hypothetical protein n=1 Tax=Streptomyces sp. PanSC9 TaxID=1520461 RepID=UPI000F47C221|nr:hypothetical protein [Streptomyces sp. PanSC9]ROP53289.1 hypothetical protein EDD94_2792 [Streptomyces sp. PanSC9]
MQTETLVGLISGLGGAVIGFAGALGGAWIQQSYGARNAKQERLEQRALASGENAISELLQLHQLVDEASMEELPDQDWIGRARAHARRAEIAVTVIPDSAHLRYRMTRLFFCMRSRYGMGAGSALGSNSPKYYYSRGAREGVEVLAAFLRGDDLPEEGTWVGETFHERLGEIPGQSPS